MPCALIGAMPDWPIAESSWSRRIRRYSLSDAKLRGLGWSLRYPFEHMMRETVRWYEANPEWLEG